MTVLFVILGVLLVIGGFSCIFTPISTVLNTGYFIGIFMLVYGVFGIVRCIKEHGSALEWILNILALIVGVFALFRPGTTLAIDSLLIFALAAYFLIDGVVLTVMAFQTKGYNRNWGWQLFAGILSLCLGIYSFAHPTFAVVAVGILIGFFLIDIGINMIALSVAVDE